QRDDGGLHLGGERDRRELRADLAARPRTQRALDVRDRIAVSEERALYDLRQARGKLALRQRREDTRVRKDRVRRMERADQVLALGDVDRRLATDGRVDHAEEGRRNLSDTDAAEERRCGEPRGVPHRTATQRDDPAVAAQPG